jgi:hypothetical protein
LGTFRNSKGKRRRTTHESSKPCTQSERREKNSKTSAHGSVLLASFQGRELPDCQSPAGKKTPWKMATVFFVRGCFGHLLFCFVLSLVRAFFGLAWQ